jgi:hypothetical protein
MLRNPFVEASPGRLPIIEISGLTVSRAPSVAITFACTVTIDLPFTDDMFTPSAFMTYFFRSRQYYDMATVVSRPAPPPPTRTDIFLGDWAWVAFSGPSSPHVRLWANSHYEILL